MQSFPQAIHNLIGRLREEVVSINVSPLFTEIFVCDSYADSSIALAILTNLSASWDALEKFQPFLFMDRDCSTVLVGFGAVDASYRSLVPRLVGLEFDGKSIDRVPRVFLQTNREIWPKLTLTVVYTPGGLRESVCILESLPWSFRCIASSIPSCVSFADSGMSRCGYITRVSEDLKNDELRKIVYARRVTYDMASVVNPAALLYKVVESTEKFDVGKRFVVLHHCGEEGVFVCVSPELLCKITNSLFETEALAGTCPTVDGFDRLSEKLVDEHASVGRYVSSKLGLLSSNVCVDSREEVVLKDVIHYRQKFQAHTNATACSLLDWAMHELHPTPAVCGFPVELARSKISSNEGFERKLFAGAIGIVDKDSAWVCVGLRSALVQQNTVHVYAGAGIVSQSDPESEWAEMELKMSQFSSVLLKQYPPKSIFTNATHAMASYLVSQLILCGATRFIVCPGSRSTPLVTAVENHSLANCVIVPDERCAGFYAVGIARAGGLPVVIVTSGTAVANLMPAVCEACEAGNLPIVLLTADRPSESQYIGETQTIRGQKNLFAEQCVFSKNYPPPNSEAPIAFERHLKSLLADVAYATSLRGVVHLNLEIQKAELQSVNMCKFDTYDFPQLDHPTCMHYSGHPNLKISQHTLSQLSNCAFVCGELRSKLEAQTLASFCERKKIMCFACVTSQMEPSEFVRVGNARNFHADNNTSHTTYIRVGGAVIDAKLQALPASIRVHTSRHDPQWTAKEYYHTDLVHWLLQLEQQCSVCINTAPLSLNGSAGSFQSGLWCEPEIARIVGEDSCLNGRSVFLSSSMPCRDFDRFGVVAGYPVGSNRGANGIDGVVSSALGFCHGHNRDTTLIIGDVASVHDLGGIALVLGVHPGASPFLSSSKLRVVSVNNYGGAIFSFLPIRQFPQVFTPYFDTPHSLNLSAIVNGMKPGSAIRVHSAEELRAALASQTVQFIECVELPSHERNVEIHTQLL